MFERYTEGARRVLFFARYETSNFGSPEITADHLLLGLLRDPFGPAGRLFARVNLSYDDVLAEIRARTGVGDRVATSVELPFGDEVKGALGHAAEESDRLRHGYIGTEHLLLGLLLTEESGASAVLRHHGMEVETVRREIVQRPTPNS